jgi:FHS family L-fucose permease-like MFS transporter
VMAIIGGAVFTPAMGFISEAMHNLAWAYCLPLAAYIFIAYYAFVTSRSGLAQ